MGFLEYCLLRCWSTAAGGLFYSRAEILSEYVGRFIGTGLLFVETQLLPFFSDFERRAASQMKSTQCCRMWHFFQNDRTRSTRTISGPANLVFVTLEIYFSRMPSPKETCRSAQVLP